MSYDFVNIEHKWQTNWETQRTFATPNPGQPGFDPSKPKYYVLDMFPYPSGVGLHVGHPLGYIATDIIARYKRSRGFNVLHPMGYDAFGLPAEQFAVEQGVHPAITTNQNIMNMTRQLKRLGLSYDWERSVATTDPEYYKWTQWIFLQLYDAWFDPFRRMARPIDDLFTELEAGRILVGIEGEAVLSSNTEGVDAVTGLPVGTRKLHELPPAELHAFIDRQRLAYMDEVPVNWCPQLGTVLANEEVTNEGRSERGNFPVYRRPLRQWMLRITAFADRLLEDLDLVDWPAATKMMQRNWIGRSEGASVKFPLGMGASSGLDDELVVFTTRPDTLFGATYMVLSPEHPLIDAISTAEQFHAVNAYRIAAGEKSDVDRIAEAGSGVKSGVFTGAYAINPVNNQPIPIWIADYVLMSYGTGAIMAVPAHDSRDFAFARHFKLPIRPVVMPDDAWLNAHGPREMVGGNPDALRAAYAADPARFDEAFTDHGTAINSNNEELSLDDHGTAQAQAEMIEWLEGNGRGRRHVQYKLRDWLFSRQRYWGEPFPILHDADGTSMAVEESDLPVLLPEMEDFRPAASDDPDAPPQPPLSRAPLAWKQVVREGRTLQREFNTMPQWAGSCWYYLRFLDPRNGERFVSAEAERYWMGGPTAATRDVGAASMADDGTASKADDGSAAMTSAGIESSRAGGHAGSKVSGQVGGVDLYVGGVEHAVLHLLYARFWHKVLFDLGHVSTPEPFARLFNQGYIQAFYYEDARGVRVSAEEIEERDGAFFYQGQPVTRHMGKMGKSLKNAIAPDDICAQYGCDTLRLYEMYLGPLDQSKIWRTADITGVHRFLQRLWRVFVNEDGSLRISDDAPPLDLQRLLHRTIKRVTDAMDNLAFNVAIAALIELNNELVKRYASDEVARTSGRAQIGVPRQIAEPMVLLLAPLAPHIAEELWQKLGHHASLSAEAWPRWEQAFLIEERIEYPVQINGKLKSKISVPSDADDAAIQAAASADEKIAPLIAGMKIKKAIIIKGRMVNLIVG